MKYELIGFVLGLILANLIGWFGYFKYLDDEIIRGTLTFITTFLLVWGGMKIGGYIDKRRDKK